MNNDIIKENAKGYTKDAIACVNDAFKWIFKAGDYENAQLAFEALENLKIAYTNLSECEKIWRKPLTKKETVNVLKKAIEQIEEALVFLQRS